VKDKRVSVIWHDAASHSMGWAPRRAAASYSPYVVESIGWLLRNDRKAVVVAQTKHGEQFSDTIDIPRGMVRKVKTLR
jgi:hypothetical protein